MAGAATAIERDFWDSRYWQAVQDRETEMDGVVYYAVLSTGVYCRPSCPSKRPRRDKVLFFSKREDAEKGGFRACLRCRPDRAEPNPRFELVREVCRRIESRLEEPARLQSLGRELGLSPFYVQRTFKALLGVSPRAWAEARKLERLKSELRGGVSVTAALYEAGYNSSSRLYERGASQLGMTPATYRKGGEGVAIAFTIFRTKLGLTLLAATARGVCAVRFGDSEKQLEAGLRAEFPRAAIARPAGALDAHAALLSTLVEGREPSADLPLDIRATAFQRRVWEALRAIPRGQTRSYAEIAKAIGNPAATRAVARACAMNPVAVVVPCHRVVRSDGGPGGYRWGMDRKNALLESERVSLSPTTPAGAAAARSRSHSPS